MTQSKEILKFTWKIILFTLPVWLLAVSYFYFDPFYVLKNYESYPDNYLKSYNRNRISTQVFLNNNDQQQYDSFILGSSKSSVFYTSDWERYIESDKTYHFDASNETISGIAGKLSFIEKQGNNIKNVLIVMDGETFQYVADTANSVIHIQDPLWSGQSNLGYHLVFFKAFFKDFYWLKYFDILINKEYKPYMYGIFENKHMLYTPIKNDFIFQEYIDRIKQDSLSYYDVDYFFERPESEESLNNVIKPYQLNYLEEISNILKRKNTDYKIVLGPNYDQKKFSKEDLELLYEYFQAENIYDFTGKNSFTEPLGNYYEIYHYKPSVARSILEIIYSQQKKEPTSDSLNN